MRCRVASDRPLRCLRVRLPGATGGGKRKVGMNSVWRQIGRNGVLANESVYRINRRCHVKK